jgi:hypothetical protein
MKEQVKELFNTLKGLIAEQYGSDAVETPQIVTEAFASVKTVDGVALVVEGELAVGSKVTVQMPEGEVVPAPEGAHTLEDGTVIVIVDGAIAEINPVATEEAAPEEMATDEPKEDYATKFAEILARVEALEAKLNGSFATSEEVSKVREIANATFKVVEELVSVPAEPVKQSFKAEKQRENRLIKLSETLKNL